MSTTNQNIQSVSPPCDVSTDTDFQADDAKLPATNKEPAIFPEVARNMSDTLEQILDVLRGSTIAGERGKDVESRFWATYKKVSNEYDDDFLERANDDMAIILTFAGLFSAVNSTFIVGMQPNPADTTNVLMLELIKIVADPNAVNDISNLSSFTGYPSSSVWMQTLAYASLSFSVLAAFGVVMGKQWLNSYKAARGRGSLEERGMQRQRKFDGLEYWHLQTVLGTFLVLLQISLLLFGLSLSANMWTQQRTISSVIICATALGILFYMATILISGLHPDSPFQTAGSAVIEAICKKFAEFIKYLRNNYYFLRRFLRGFQSRYLLTHTPDTFGRSSAIRWILETSTNPEVVEAAAEMVPRVQWELKLGSSVVYARLVDNLAMSVGRPELFVTYGKAMAHLCIEAMESIPIHWKEHGAWDSWGEKSRFLRDAFTDARLACNQLKDTEDEDVRWKHMADARTALRTMVVHGFRFRLSRPDREAVIWNGDLRWRHSNGDTPSCEEFDWLIDYLVGKAPDIYTSNGKTESDALLALSAMRGLGSSAKRLSYITVLIRCMTARTSRVRHAALRAVSDAREELASITCGSMPQGVDATLLDEISRALSTVLRSDYNEDQSERMNAYLVGLRDLCYLRLIFALVKNDEWRERLTRDGHIERCTSLHDKVHASSAFLDKVYLAGILLCIDPSGGKISLNPTQEKRWMLMQRAWKEWDFHITIDIENNFEALPTLVMATRQHMPDPNNDVARVELAALATNVKEVLESLKKKQENRRWQETAIMTLVDAGLPTMQSWYDELSSYAENGNTLQGDDGLSKGS